MICCVCSNLILIYNHVVIQIQETQGTDSGLERNCTPTPQYRYSVSFRQFRRQFPEHEPIVATFATQCVQEKHHTKKTVTHI